MPLSVIGFLISIPLVAVLILILPAWYSPGGANG
jgi:hypothetical protein